MGKVLVVAIGHWLKLTVSVNPRPRQRTWTVNRLTDYFLISTSQVIRFAGVEFSVDEGAGAVGGVFEGVAVVEREVGVFAGLNGADAIG
jgi:hypothetical protein